MKSDTDFEFNPPRRVAIIGAGLLGGSFGLAIRQRFPDVEVIGVSRSLASREAAVESAAVTSATDNVEAACIGSDLVVVSVPVDKIVDMVLIATKCCARDGIVIDLGSTKASIVSAIDHEEVASRMFVGTHPIAGSEKTGAAHARADLFVGKAVVVTPGRSTPEPLVQRVEHLWRALGANVVRMTPDQHDDALAKISHVPHLVASMLAALLPQESSALVGTGWLDTTRVASGDPDLWTAICRENGSAVLQGLSDANAWLSKLSRCIAAKDFDSVHQLLAESKEIRDKVIASRAK